MSETEPIPPTSSVTALRIPIIKKGEYDLWSMKMRQYIAITDHILWDIITNGNQTTTDPASPSVSAPKTSLAANARRNNEKALNILLSAIPDRHLLSFHDAVDARSLWKAIKARFGGNEASKKMQKNLLKQQFETFTIGSREELDSAYERFQHILSMLELHDATVSIEDANVHCFSSISGSRMPPKRTSTSEAPAMTQAAIRKLVADSIIAKHKLQQWQMLTIPIGTQEKEKLL
ncbi:hypothetical protein Tco_1157094 [Tanacetum coccineum]